jgi:O-antigen/teichoic acid export membrane protein
MTTTQGYNGGDHSDGRFSHHIGLLRSNRNSSIHQSELRRAESRCHDRLIDRSQIRRVARGSIAAFAIYIAGAGLAYCSQFAIVRVLSVESYGIYSYVLAWMSVLAYFSALGFDVALLRFLPAYETQRAWALIRGVIQYAERRVALVGATVTVAGVSVIMLRSESLSPALKDAFLIGFTLVPVLALLWIRCSVTRAFGGVVWAVAPDRIVRDGTLLAVVLVASLGMRRNVDAPFVMMVTFVSSALALATATMAARRLQPGALAGVLPAYAASTWRLAALPLLAIGVTEVLMNRTGVLLLGWIGDAKSSGVYSLAFNIAFVVALPRTAVNTLFAPTVSALFTRKDWAMLQALITKSSLWTLCAATFIAALLFIFAEPLLAWFGKEYAVGAPALRILLIGQVIAAGAGSQMYVMTMTGNERGAAVLLIAGALGNILTGAILIDLFGLIGAAIATTITLTIWNAAVALFIWRRLHLLSGVLALLR